MDSNTRRLINNIEEYLEINADRANPFISNELRDKLSGFADELRHTGGWGDEPSPGEKAVQAASGPTADAVTFNHEAEAMTPGERALAAAQGVE